MPDETTPSPDEGEDTPTPDDAGEGEDTPEEEPEEDSEDTPTPDDTGDSEDSEEEEEEEPEEDTDSDDDGEDTPEEYSDVIAERDRLRAALQRERQERAEAEVQSFCAQHLPPALRDDAEAILTSLEGTDPDVIVFEHDEHDDLAGAFRAFLQDSMSFQHLFDEYASDGPDADDDGVPKSCKELADAIRNNMAGA